jgi:hypothetical protein
MHHVKFNIILRAQIYVHTAQYTIMKQPILVLMRVPTKLLCVKKYLRTPCAPYYVCAYCARLILVRAYTHNNHPCNTIIYRAHYHAMVSRAVPNLTCALVCQPFPRTLSMILILVTSKLLLCEYSLQLHPFGPSKLSVELRL